LIAALGAAIKIRNPDFRQKKFGFFPKGTAISVINLNNKFFSWETKT
jgi:hypothetical protein